MSHRLAGAFLWSVSAIAASMLNGCSPRVELAPSKEPITINLNVKVDHDVRVRVEKDLDQVINKESGLF